jgi:hypothetical protein
MLKFRVFSKKYKRAIMPNFGFTSQFSMQTFSVSIFCATYDFYPFFTKPKISPAPAPIDNPIPTPEEMS